MQTLTMQTPTGQTPTGQTPTGQTPTGQTPTGHPAPRQQDAALELLDTAADALSRAQWAPSAALRYELAYLAALRSGAAVLARRARPRSLRTRPRGMWRLLAATAPELAEWAGFFTICGQHAAALSEGRAAVSGRQADDLLRDAAAFLAIVTSRLSGAGAAAPVPHARAAT